MAIPSYLHRVSVVVVESKPQFFSRISKDSGSTLQVSASQARKDASNSLQTGCILYLSTAAGSICVLLTALDASALRHPGPSLGMTAPLPDSQSLNIAIPIPQADQWGFGSYGSTAPAPGTKKKIIKHYGNRTRCPEWNLKEYETVVPDLRGKPKPFPRQGSQWDAHNSNSTAYRSHPFRGSPKPTKSTSSSGMKTFNSFVVDGCFEL